MPGSRATPEALLTALDPASGGLPSGSAESVAAWLRTRGFLAEPEAVRDALDELARKGKLERVETEDGDAAYTRPEVLLRAAGVTSVYHGSSRRR